MAAAAFSFPLGANAGSDETGLAEVEYRLGSDFAGTATGECDSPGLVIQTGAPGALRIASQGGEWILHRVRFNETHVGGSSGPWVEALASSDLAREASPIAAGESLLEWTETSRIHLYGSPGPLAPSTNAFKVGFWTQRLASTGLVDWSPTLTLFDDSLGVVVPAPYGVSGPHRQVAMAGGTIGVAGDLTLYVENARLTTPAGGVLEAPVGSETETLAGVDGAATLEQTRIRYALVSLSRAQFTAAPELGTVFCQDLSADLAGHLNVYLAKGRVAAHGETLEFERRELTLQGAFAWSETPGDQAVRANGRGAFEAVELDFDPMIGPGSGVRALVAAGVAGSLGLLLGALAYKLFKVAGAGFSRLDERAVVGHASRRLVLDAVRAQPNVNLRTLTRTTGLSQSEVRYHARVLESRGLVRSHKVHRDRCFVARDTLEQQGRSLLQATPQLVVQNDGAVGVVVESVPAEGIRLNPLLLRVCKRLGVSRPGAWKAVRRAERYGFVRRVRTGREVWIRCAA